jgi:hypothetical protein
MVTERFYNCATADCRHGTHELKSIGEGRDLIRQDNMRIPILRDGMKVRMGRGRGGWTVSYYYHYPF